VYNELLQRVPHHPGIIRQENKQECRKRTIAQLGLLKNLLNPEYSFLELGAGDCLLSFEVAKHVKKVYAIDVSDELMKTLTCPKNFELVITDGCRVPITPESINVAYSNQMVEHVHPDDTNEQLRGIFNALVPGGIYLCVTPHRFTGPHDISKWFDNAATGLHLKEYTNRELYNLFRRAGFSRVQSYRRLGKRYVKRSLTIAMLLQCVLDRLPYPVRSKTALAAPFKSFLAIRLIATK
jgi:ubiquinone/menaquinone biosynthesis C-methylase UbiE